MAQSDEPTTEPKVFFEIVFRPSVTLTTVIRRFVTDFCETVGGDDGSGSRLALATHELLENVVKYGVPDDLTTLEVELFPLDGVASIRTNNRSDERHIATLRRRFAELKAAPDPFRFYQELLRAAAGDDSDASGSGLGLARIRCEGEMDVDLSVEGDRVRISALAKTALGATP